MATIYVVLGCWDHEGADSEPLLVTTDRQKAMPADRTWTERTWFPRSLDDNLAGKWESSEPLTTPSTTYGWVEVSAWEVTL